MNSSLFVIHALLLLSSYLLFAFGLLLLINLCVVTVCL